ncbi:MAG: ArsR family transcriptional regulator [archaeon GB-1867-005]|nr:ArsR family transcriptional regulator [Candidatus Culexmicrobium cathedralense]
MRVKLTRILSPEELLKMEKNLEAKYGVAFRELVNQYLRGGKRNSIYSKWAKLHYAYMAYEEEGELNFTFDEYVHAPISKLMKIFTEKKIRILMEIARGVESISDLARKVGRDVTNVYRDLKILEKHKIVKLEKAGKRVIPRIAVEKLTIEFT